MKHNFNVKNEKSSFPQLNSVYHEVMRHLDLNGFISFTSVNKKINSAGKAELAMNKTTLNDLKKREILKKLQQRIAKPVALTKKLKQLFLACEHIVKNCEIDTSYFSRSHETDVIFKEYMGSWTEDYMHIYPQVINQAIADAKSDVGVFKFDYLGPYNYSLDKHRANDKLLIDGDKYLTKTVEEYARRKGFKIREKDLVRTKYIRGPFPDCDDYLLFMPSTLHSLWDKEKIDFRVASYCHENFKYNKTITPLMALAEGKFKHLEFAWHDITDINIANTVSLLAHAFNHDINKQNKYGNTPLIMAVLNGNIEVVRGLLKEGANLHIKNISGHNCFYYAKNNKEMMELLNKARRVENCTGAALLFSQLLDANKKYAENSLPVEVTSKIAAYYSEETEPAIQKAILAKGAKL